MHDFQGKLLRKNERKKERKKERIINKNIFMGV